MSFKTTVLTATVLAAFSSALMAVPAQPRVALPGGFSPLAAISEPLGAVSPASKISLAISLPLRNQVLMQQMLQELYDPNSALFGQYLTSAQFAAQFGPTPADYAAVAAFAKAKGLTVTQTYPERTLLDVTGPASAVQAAFGVSLRQYESPNGEVFRAAVTQPTIPATMRGRISAVTGFDSAAIRYPQFQKRDTSTALVSPNAGGTGLGGSFVPTDIRTAYNLTSTGLDGTGQTLAVFELDTYTPKDVLRYERNFFLPVVPLENVLVDPADPDFPLYPGGGTGEVILDIDMQIALAPKAAKVLVYIAPNTDQGVVDCYQQIATDNRAKSISTSWATFEDQVSGTALFGESVAFQQMALQGQSIFTSAGDTGGVNRRTGDVTAGDPSGQPFVCSVGGTTLRVKSSGVNENYLSETTWNDGPASAGGGGVSVFWPIPFYQKAAATLTANAYPNSGVSATMRNVPDVSLNADPNTGYLVYVTDPSAGAGYFIYGGTSASAPLWAGFTALANQSRAKVGKRPIGFPNPALYSFGPGGATASHYASDFHDIADGSNNIPFIAEPGFDNATGLGTFNGANLIADLTAF